MSTSKKVILAVLGFLIFSALLGEPAEPSTSSTATASEPEVTEASDEPVQTESSTQESFSFEDSTVEPELETQTTSTWTTEETYIPSTYAPSTSSSYSCSISKTCPEMNSCAEAYFYLNTCGDSARDGDNDGVPCEDICG